LGTVDALLGDTGLKLFKGFVIEKDLDPASIDKASVRNILVVLRHQMGDMLCASPMLRSLKSAFSRAKLILVTKASTRYDEIFTGNNAIADEVLNYEYGFENFINLVKELRDKKIDLAIIPSTVVYSGTNHLMAHFCHAALRAGVKSMDFEKNPAAYILNIKNDFLWGSKKIHQVERNLDIIRQLGIVPKETNIRIVLNSKNIEYAENLLEQKSIDRSKLLLGFHPGAAKQGNVWNPGNFAELASALAGKTGGNIVVSEGPIDENWVNQFQTILKEKYGNSNIIRHKGTLMNNVALISKCALFVTNDTGVMHLASGLKTPVVALFGPTKAYQWGPLGEKKVSIQSKKPNIDEISVKSVLEVCMKLLDSAV